jgi:hypothetical protein
MQKVQTCLIGDSGAWGACSIKQSGIVSLTRFSPTPGEIFSTSPIFQVVVDLSKPGNSFKALTSPSSDIRQNVANLPNGITLAEYVAQHPEISAYLISLGGNDTCLTRQDTEDFVNSVINTAEVFATSGKLFGFAGVPQVNCGQSHSYATQPPAEVPVNSDIYNSGLIYEAGRIAQTAEILKQVCLWEGYPYVDIRNSLEWDLQNTTCDIIHPTKEYSEAVWTKLRDRFSQ